MSNDLVGVLIIPKSYFPSLPLASHLIASTSRKSFFLFANGIVKSFPG